MSTRIHTLRQGVGLTGLAQQRGLIDAAIAVNEAPTLDEAFQVLAEAGLALIGCDRLAVVAWNDSLSLGTVRADTGPSLGEPVPATAGSAEAILNETVYAGPPRVEGFSLQLAHSLRTMAFVVRVPLVTAHGIATFHALWEDVLSDEEAVAAAELLRTLTRLTSLAERSLREGERLRLDSVLDGVADGVVVCTATSATPNAAARTLLAIPPDVEFRTALFNPRDLEGKPFELTAIVGARTMETGLGGRFRIRVTALDSRELVLDGSISPAPGGAVIVFRDVTAEHEREVVNERYLYALFNAIPIPLTVADAASQALVSANQAFLDLIGYALEEIVGLGPPFPWWEPEEHELSASEPGTAVRRVYRRKDGRPLPVEVFPHIVRGDEGKPALLLGVITDLSEKRRLDQQLVQSGKLAAIGELAAGVAHEINNPLFAILGLTEFLLQEAEPESKAHQRLVLIQQTGLEIKEIVRALLDFARENAEERHLVVLDDVVRSTVDLIRRTNAHKAVELVDTYNDDAALVSASPNQLKQIFLNLIANARQAMPNGGNVSIQVHRDGEHVIAVVSDDGPGIEPSALERIFEPFFTTKRLAGGTGLGLSVSLGIAESHGGTLTAASDYGRGASFTLRLPIAAGGGGVSHILVIDDEEVIRSLIVEILETVGHNATGAESAERALTLLETTDFDLVVSDVVMPGLSGLELLEIVRDRRASLPVVLVTGAGTYDTLSQALTRGAAGLVTKPFAHAELQTAVADALERASRSRDEMRERLLTPTLASALANAIEARDSTAARALRAARHPRGADRGGAGAQARRGRGDPTRRDPPRRREDRDPRPRPAQARAARSRGAPDRRDTSRRSATSCSSRSTCSPRRVRSSVTTTSAGTVPGTRTAWPATRSRSAHGSSASPTRSR